MAYCVGFDIGGTKCAVVLGEYGECGAHGEFGGQGVAVPGAQDSAAGACMQNGAAGRVSIGQSAHGGQDGAGGLAAMAGAQGAAVERSLRIVGKSAFPTAGSPNQTIQAACAAIDGMLAAHGLCAAQISGIGISCGGPLDSASGLILSPPNLPGWDGVPVAGMLRERYAADVRLENDANACAVAEWKFGAARGARDAVFLTFGTGLGAG
ncbi:MAG: ROK family protein, partial [Clostridiales bacterium]|nr:ROK family protein [Clostridiales bacterium]